jgi:hypothetical protein
MVRAWVIAVNAGYGHQRAAYPLKDIAEERIITANSDKIISEDEQSTWRFIRGFYELISRMQSIPIIGRYLFGLYDLFQHIPQFHPMRNLSRPSIQTYFIRHQVKAGLCRSIFEYIRKKDLPVITTFFITAIAAEYYGVKRIYCICTDSDINRAWVPVESKKTRIIYCAPCKTVEQRLLEYGVPPENIRLTGFPLPRENIGRNQRTLKHDLALRLSMLDPKRVFITRMRNMVESYLGEKARTPKRPLTLMLAVGGAGAQWRQYLRVMRSLRQSVSAGEVRLFISVGTNLELLSKFQAEAKTLGIQEKIGMIHSLNLHDYFETFNKALRQTDIIWSKPSEISFYAGLGIPIILAPPLGHHEERNQRWLESMGLAFPQENPDYTHEWLTSWLEDGRLAEAAFEGPIKIMLNGTDKIISLAAGDPRFRAHRS